MAYLSRRRSADRTDFDPFVVVAWLVGGGAACLWALPALVLGLLGAFLLRNRSWSVLLWLGLTIIGLGVSALLAVQSLVHLLQSQMDILGREVQNHQAHVLQWDLLRLWSTTWPLWLHTLGVAPLVALVSALVSSLPRGAAEALCAAEASRQEAVARAQRRAIRRLRRSSRTPESVAGQMVVGVPLSDEADHT